MDTEGAGEATHFHSRALERERRIDSNRELRNDAKLIRDRQRANRLAVAFEVDRRAGANRRDQVGIALAGTREADRKPLRAGLG